MWLGVGMVNRQPRAGGGCTPPSAASAGAEMANSERRDGTTRTAGLRGSANVVLLRIHRRNPDQPWAIYYRDVDVVGSFLYDGQTHVRLLDVSGGALPPGLPRPGSRQACG